MISDRLDPEAAADQIRLLGEEKMLAYGLLELRHDAKEGMREHLAMFAEHILGRRLSIPDRERAAAMASDYMWKPPQG